MRTLEGTIVSTKMRKTVVVRVDRLRKHPRYGKFYRISRTFKAHAADDTHRAGDVVRLVETRPMSKDKRWTIAAVIRRAPADGSAAEAGEAAAANP